MNSKKSTVTLTFSECAENSPGNQQIGNIAEDGFSIKEIKAAKKKFLFEEPLAKCRFVNLNKLISDGNIESEEAGILVIRNGLDIMLGEGTADKLAEEMYGLVWAPYRRYLRYG